MNNYWQQRLIDSQRTIADKSINALNSRTKQLYRAASDSIINDALIVYLRLNEDLAEGEELTINKLYLLDKYYNLNNDINERLTKLGNKTIDLYTKEFIAIYDRIYKDPALSQLLMSLDIDPAISFNINNRLKAEQLLKGSWLGDGKKFSDRIWANQKVLQQTLNDGLAEIIIAGKKSTDLKHKLQDRFNVSYNRAKSLVVTETAHIQTMATADRYKDSGIEQYEFYASPDERKCPKCKELHGKHFPVNEAMPGKNASPVHTNCRCAILPVI